MQVSGPTIDRLLKPTKDAARPKGMAATKDGWTENVAVHNGAHNWVLAAMDEIVSRLLFPLVGLDTGNGGEFINFTGAKSLNSPNSWRSPTRPTSHEGSS